MRKVFVLDDDPTGTQGVHGVPVLARWDVETLAVELENGLPAAFVLTNTRALPEREAIARIREIAENLRMAEERTGCAFSVVSRSDSTLRGHFPAEPLAIADALHCPDSPILLCPFFAAGGRVTVEDIHYLFVGGQRIPVAETEFARDHTFGYRHSNLRDWVREKSADRLATESISLEDIRANRVVERLSSLSPGVVCILNCETPEDMRLLVAGVHAAEARGHRFLFRTAASFAAAYAGVTEKPWTPAPHQTGPGLIVVGSYVDKTTEQLATLSDYPDLASYTLDVRQLLDERRRGEILAASRWVSDALQQGRTALLSTSRERVQAGDLTVGGRVSSALVEVVRGVSARPQWIVAKGGITSNDIATEALKVRRAMVLGQIAPGVPVWECGPETLWPGIPLVVFPGNVGNAGTLAQVTSLLMGTSSVPI